MACVLAAIILAAGESTRMGRPKALLLDPEGRPFVVRLVDTFAAAGLSRIIVVAGSQAPAISGVLDAVAPRITPVVVTNPNPARGQVSSLWVGLDEAEREGAEAVLVTLVDIPMVRAETVDRIVSAWHERRASIVRPAFGGRHGHPVLFDRSIFAELRSAPLDEGARAVVHAHAADIIEVDVSDEGCVTDVDTPADYQKLIGGRGAC
jgi:CTP:molybdopterin cytidylyltransferase MocA